MELLELYTHLLSYRAEQRVGQESAPKELLWAKRFLFWCAVSSQN